eukprot:CAMPEP_0194133568 /NCGR_PEP_ID=MMETSP0152-20130528/3683_1 /TAXON_ID=1049557 /ORGANISM="Thalassiothrix antarctica, Strain L6-D1" /LENGTH=1134 /DNA_ID=CAMNT_0038828897 /DNA_START=38 /DNA_END=3443 /DNA_ORIENTATION=+
MEADQPFPGRVMRLHFKCRADLPIGSALRVTGSTLWSPTHLAQEDPLQTLSAASQTASQAPILSTGAEEDWVDVNILNQSHASTYTSSIEMYTTPETYPLWQTRRPVVIVLHKPKGIHHHYYRYLVVTPGAKDGETLKGQRSVEEEDISDSDSERGVESQYQVATTSNEYSGASQVMLWEDPFEQFSGNNLCNLPYRTIDIDTVTNEVTDQDQIDNWNGKEDASFQAYSIREAINEENRRLLQSEMPSRQISRDGSRTPPFQTQQRIFFVCYHLPVVVVQDKGSGHWKASWTDSLLAKTDGSQICSTYQAHWVGTVTTHPPITKEEDKQAVQLLLEGMNCYPLFLNSDMAEAHYFGFCKQVLWPAFHNIDILDLNVEEQSSWDQSNLDNWWKAYKEVNQTFCTTMLGLIQPNDILWVHDYHLSLLPKLMTSGEINLYGKPITRQVFFLHIPFPTSQIFRELECGSWLLEGMLHAHVVGFHAFDHARHFLNASKRIFGLKYETMAGGLIGVHFSGRTVMVTMSNVSIEPRMIDTILRFPTVNACKSALKEKHDGRFIIGGCDIGQRLQGVSFKLLAFERLLRDYPVWQNKVVMVQRILLPGTRKGDEGQTVGELRFLVKRIKDTFGEAVMDYEEIQGSSIPTDQRLALWKASDVLMATPLREGLNHWPMEYIYARKEPETPGVVIASEFSAVASILNGALRVNPYDIQMTITTIDKALTMDLQEREGRRYRDIDFVSTSPSDKWTKNVLRDLKDAIQMAGSESSQTSAANTPNTSRHGHQQIIDSTAAYLARESNLSFTRLNREAVKRAYDSTTNRVFILDFNGTIVIKEPPGKYLKREILGTSGNKPLPEVIEALNKLCTDSKNTVYVVSGDSAENVLNAIGNVPGMGLAVSNGAHFSTPVYPGQKRQWHIFDLGVDWDAVKRVALPVLSKYTARSNGSFVKLTQFSIGWSYYSCDPEWGSMQASHLVLELKNELRAFDVRFVTLKGVVEIVPQKLNKGLFVKKVLRDAVRKSNQGIDFILCMGDDISDEKMFTSVYSYVAEIGDEENAQPDPPIVDENPRSVELLESMKARDPMYTYTVAVGKKPSHASQWVSDGMEVGNLLVHLTGGQPPIKTMLEEKALNDSPELWDQLTM